MKLILENWNKFLNEAHYTVDEIHEYECDDLIDLMKKVVLDGERLYPMVLSALQDRLYYCKDELDLNDPEIQECLEHPEFKKAFEDDDDDDFALQEIKGGKRLLLKKIKQIVAGNKFLSNLANQVSKDSVKSFSNYYFLSFPGLLKSRHIAKHFDPKNVGSSWSISQEEAGPMLLSIMSKQKPTKVTERGVTKYKWLNVDTGKDIGFDTVVKDPTGKTDTIVDLERFGMTDRVKDWSVVSKVAQQNDYELANEDGSPYTEQDLAAGKPSFIKQEIGTVSGSKESNPTRFVNIIAAEIGKVGGKPVLSLLTTFPGIQPVDGEGKDLTDKKQFKDHGYYFLK